MANLVEVVTKYIRPYYYYIIGFAVLIIFIIIGYNTYNTIQEQRNGRFSDVANKKNRSGETVIYFFHVEWCPHCKKALPEWNNFKSKHNGKEIHGYKLKCVDIDCTNETSEITQYINTYNIDSYPTVKLVRDGTIIDFESKITSSSLEKFVNTMLYQ